MNNEQISEGEKTQLLAYCWQNHLDAARAGARELAEYCRARYFQLKKWNDVGFRSSRFNLTRAEGDLNVSHTLR
jgi:hypothetical protein